jgi:hypothetical protein
MPKMATSKKNSSFPCATQTKGNYSLQCSQITKNIEKVKSTYFQRWSTHTQYTSTFIDLITSRKSQIKPYHLWTYLINVCTTFNIGRMHGKPKTNCKSHNRSKFYVASLFVGASMCILTMSDLYSHNTHFKRLNMDIQWVLMLRKNFKPFVCNVLARFTNSTTFLGLCEKNLQRL